MNQRKMGNNRDPLVGLEIFRDLLFIELLFKIREKLKNNYLKEFYGVIAISFLSIVIHECIQAGMIEAADLDKKIVDELKSFRTRVLKQQPLENKRTVEGNLTEMGIDFSNYVFDIVLLVNNQDNELWGINVTHWDINNMDLEEFAILDSLTTIPSAIIDRMLVDFGIEDKQSLIDSVEEWCCEFAEEIERQIDLHKKTYASSSLFSNSKLCRQDKLFILYYYILLKQAALIQKIVPVLEINDTLSTKYSLAKFKAVVIQNIGDYFNKVDTSLTREIKNSLKEKITDNSFYINNRKVRNNIHYKKNEYISKKQIEEIMALQDVYIDTILSVFKTKIRYSFGWKYKLINFIAFHTDTNIIKIRKKYKYVKSADDITHEMWEEVKQ